MSTMYALSKSRLTMCRWWKCCSRLPDPPFSAACCPPAGLEIIGTAEEVGREQWMSEGHTTELEDIELELERRALFLLLVFLLINGEVLLV